MSLPRFFLQHQILESEPEKVFELRLDADDLKHAKALRLATGEHIEVIDADSNFYELCIESADAQRIMASITSHNELDEWLPRIALFQGLPKLDKLDTIIRGATEIGVSEIHPVLCERSISRPDAKRSRTKHERWQAIAKSAAMQSGRDSIPKVLDIEALPAAAKLRFDAAFIFWEEASACDSPSIEQALTQALKPMIDENALPSDVSIAIWIGPEGGLSEDEVKCITEFAERAYVLTLGPTILRTETAGMIAPALVIYEARKLLAPTPVSCSNSQFR